jgi:hypothetical protein
VAQVDVTIRDNCMHFLLASNILLPQYASCNIWDVLQSVGVCAGHCMSLLLRELRTISKRLIQAFI